jgi:hypothetical protein
LALFEALSRRIELAAEVLGIGATAQEMPVLSNFLGTNGLDATPALTPFCPGRHDMPETRTLFLLDQFKDLVSP